MSSDRPQQLTFELPPLQAQGAEDFLVSPANEAAVRLIESWPQWPAHAAGLIGPAGSGKSHLVEIWRVRSGAAVIAGAALQEDALRGLADTQAGTQAVAVEDVDLGIGDERALFHLLNLAREERRTVLLTSRRPPGEIEATLPDLRSRLRALAVVEIAPPDDALLRMLLVKLFADRQLLVEPAVIEHLAMHMERSADAARRLVETIDRLALMSQRKVSRPLAAEALRELGSRPQ